MSFEPPVLNPALNLTTASSVTGLTTTSKTLLGSITIKGGQMGLNDCLIILADWFVTNSAGNKTIDIDFGSTNVLTTTASGQSGQTVMVMIHNRNSLSSQLCNQVAVTAFYGASSNSFVSATENTANDITISFFGTVATANADTITLENLSPFIWKNNG